MIGTGYDEQSFVVALQFLESVLSHIARMSLLTVYHHHCTANLCGIGKDRCIQKSEVGGRIPPLRGIERTGVITSGSFVISMIIAYKLRRIGRNRIDHPSCTDIRTVPIIFGALGIEPAAHLITCVGVVRLVEISVGRTTADIVHSRCDGNLDARVVSGSVDGKTTPAAYTEDPDTFPDPHGLRWRENRPLR